MKKAMKLSVIVPCYNAAVTISEQLEALANQTWSEPWELIVVDNRSTDESMTIVRQYQERLPNLRIINASDKPGQPYALNVGIRAATSEVVAFCDADDEVAPGWVAAIGEALRHHDFVAGRFECAKLNPAWLQAGHAQEKGLNQYRYPPYLPHAGSGNMGVKRALHEAVGGFDESMPYLFDTDFCFKLQLAKTSLYWMPDAVLHYRAPHTFKDVYRKAQLNGEYNVMLYKRYRPLGMPTLSLKDGLHGWKNLLFNLPQIFDPKKRMSWFWLFNWRVGRIRGCLKHRVIAF